MNTKTASEGRGISLNPDTFVRDDKQGELQDCRKYMVPTQDDKGHSMQMRLSLPKSFGARFQKALASGKFPFLRYGPSQLARYCLKRGLDELEKEIPGGPSSLLTLPSASSCGGGRALAGTRPCRCAGCRGQCPRRSCARQDAHARSGSDRAPAL